MWEWAESVWFQLISEWFHLISSDFSWFQCDSRFPFCEITLQCDSRSPFCGITHMWWFQISLLWNHSHVVIPDFPSVESLTCGDSRFPFCEITLQCDSRFPFCGITHMWWFQISLLWNHTESPWINLNQPEITLNHTEIMLNQTEWFRVVTLVLKGNPTVNLWDFSWITSINSLVGVFCWIITRFGRCTPFTRDDSAEHTFQLVDFSDSEKITLVYRWDFQ